MFELGHVQADNTENSESLASIRAGFIRGEGLLGEVLTAALELAESCQDYGYYASDSALSKEALEDVKSGRVRLYQALKAVEQAAAGVED